MADICKYIISSLISTFHCTSVTVLHVFLNLKNARTYTSSVGFCALAPSSTPRAGVDHESCMLQVGCLPVIRWKAKEKA